MTRRAANDDWMGDYVEQANQSRIANPTRLGRQASRSTTFEPGSTFGEYTIVRRIGRGGQGSVFEVLDGLGLSWALKVSEEMVLQDANAEMRFAREARCVAENLSQLPRHSGVLVGEHYGVWDRRFYVKMKLLRGESLAQRLRRLGQLSIYEAVRIAERITFAIGQAHAMGVLHRDLKPENIFLSDNGEVVVLDWGCLQLIEAGHQQTTLRGVICTPGYAPIEQYLATTALNLTPAVDLYAVGVMLYEALAGYHPFLNWSRSALPSPAALPVPAKPGEVPSGANPTHAARDEHDGFGHADSALGTAAPAAARAPLIDELERGSVITVRLMDDMFGAQTERHTVPDELLSHLHSVVTGGVTWRSPSEMPAVRREGAPLNTLSTVNTQPLTAQPSRSEHSGWTLSPSQVHAPGSTRTMSHVNVARPGGLGADGAAIGGPAVGGASAGGAAAAGSAGAVAPEQVVRRVPKGEPPRRFSLIEVLAFQERVKPRPIDGVPPELGKLLLQLLAKRPQERPQDALQVSERLRALIPQLSESPSEFAASTPELNSRYLKRALVWIQLRQNSRGWVWAAAGVVVAGVTGGLSYYGMSASGAAPASTVVVANASETATSAPHRQPAAAQSLPPSTQEPSATSLTAASATQAPSVSSSLRPLGREMTGLAGESRAGIEKTPSPADAASRSRDKKKRRATEKNSAAVPTATAPTLSPIGASAPVVPAQQVRCAQPPCEPGAGDATSARKLQANPSAVMHRTSNKLWLE